MGLKSLATTSIELELIDLSDNLLKNLKELKILEGLKYLKSVTFHKNEEETNPFCE